MDKYYVYGYFDPRIPYQESFMNINFKYLPFYIGKGTANRAYRHMENAGKPTDCRKTNRINDILEAGKQPHIDILINGLKERQALYIESLFIEYFKTVDEGGLLLNITKPNVEKFRIRSTMPGIYYPDKEFIAAEIYEFPTIQYLILTENTLEILSIHYTVESVAQEMGITRSLCLNLVENDHPYNILRKKVVISREKIPEYFAINCSDVAKI